MEKEEFAIKYTSRLDKEYNQLSDEIEEHTPYKDEFLSDLNEVIRGELIKFVHGGFLIDEGATIELVDHYLKSQQK